MSLDILKRSILNSCCEDVLKYILGEQEYYKALVNELIERQNGN